MRKRHRRNYPARARQSLKTQYVTFYRSRLSKGVAARESLLRRLDRSYAFTHLQNYVTLLTGGYMPMSKLEARTLHWLACEEQALDVRREIVVHRMSYDRRRFFRHYRYSGNALPGWKILNKHNFRQERYVDYGKVLSCRVVGTLLHCNI